MVCRYVKIVMKIYMLYNWVLLQELNAACLKFFCDGRVGAKIKSHDYLPMIVQIRAKTDHNLCIFLGTRVTLTFHYFQHE